MLCGVIRFLYCWQVEVAFSGVEVKEDTEPETKATALKVLPPWMIREGMVLTKEQRGEVKPDVMKMDQPSSSTDDKKQKIVKDDQKSIEVSAKLGGMVVKKRVLMKLEDFVI